MASSPVPNLQFNSYNPMETALSAALKTYEGLSRGEAQRLQNEMNKAKMPYAAQTAEAEAMRAQQEAAMYEQLQRADMDYKRSQIERNTALNNAGPRIGPGIAGQVDAYNRAIAAGDEQGAQQIMMGIKMLNDSRINPNMRAWNSLSMPERDQYVGSLKAFGYDPAEASRMGQSGISMEQAAAMKGISSQEALSLHPENAPSTTTRDRAADRTGREAESKVLNDFIVPAISRYLGPDVDLLGFSTEQLGDALSGMNEDDQANLIAAYKIQMDLAANQLKLGAGIAGIQAIKAQMEHSLTELKPMLPSISPKVWSKAQYKANDILSEGARAYSNAAENYGRVINEEKKLGNSLKDSMKGKKNPGEMSREEIEAELAELQGESL